MTRLTASLEIARIALLRTVRERANAFWILAFPLLIVMLIGLSFGGQQARTVVVAAPAHQELAERLEEALAAEPGVRVRRGDRDDAIDDLARARVAAVVSLPDDADRALQEGAAVTPVEVQVVVRPEAVDTRLTIESVVADVAAPLRADAVAIALGADPDSPALGRTETGPRMQVDATQVGDGLANEFAGLGQFTLGASSQLVLFVFLTTLTGATRIVEARQLGVTRRMLATPTSAGQVVLGEGLGRFAVAVVQAVWIVLATLLLFGVDWGDPVASLAVITVFAAVSASAGLLLGALSTNVNQAGGLSTLVGLVLAALGGCMAPLDIFSDNLRRVAHLTPHAWANDAFAEITRRSGGLVDVLPELGVLTAWAVGLGALAAQRLRVGITGAASEEGGARR